MKKIIHKKLLHFLQYHNLTLVILMFIVGFGTASLASENVRNAIFEREIKEVGIDNTLLLVTDIESWDFQPKILDIEEDENYYYVDYEYKTLGIKDNVWQEITQQKELKISKEFLSQTNFDLPSYITKEISEVILYEYNLLKDSQKIAREQGLTQKQKVIVYKGLIGQILNLQPKAIIEEGEKIALETSKEQGHIESFNQNQPQMPETQNENNSLILDREIIRQIVEEILAQKGQISLQPVGTQNTATTSTSTENTTTQNSQNLIEVNPQADTTSSENASTSTSSCIPNWQCTDWQPLEETVCQGEKFTQTRICNDLNECGTDEGKPVETQEAIGTKDCSQDTTTSDESVEETATITAND